MCVCVCVRRVPSCFPCMHERHLILLHSGMIRHVGFQFEAFNLKRERERYCREGGRKRKRGKEEGQLNRHN